MIFAILRIFHLTHGRYYDMFSRVRRASGGVGWVGVGEVITFVGTFTHIPCYTCFPGTQGIWFLAPLSFLFSAIRARILWAKGWEHVSIRWLKEPQTEHCGFRRPLPRLVMFDLKHQHRLLLLLLLHWHVCKNHASCNNMTFWFCSLTIDYPWEYQVDYHDSNTNTKTAAAQQRQKTLET